MFETIYGLHLAALGKPRCIVSMSSELSENFEFFDIELNASGDP